MTLAAIPSPTTSVWHLGPLPIRAYALFIVAGIVIACLVTEYRLRQRGAPKYAVLDIAVWAVPFGIVGARIYHVLSSPQNYFGEGGDPVRMFAIWEGGLGIWGAVAGGAVGVWLACRQLKLPFLVVADAAAVGLPLAQAIGRLGNWFNNELYGSRTTLPWGLEVHDMDGGRALVGPSGEPVTHAVLYHPTFLYELLWNIGVAILVWQVGKRLRLGRGRQFALYVAAYCAGRFWIEMLRIDGETEGTVVHLLGVRLNVWVAALVFLAAMAYLLRMRGPQEYLLPIEGEDGYRVVTEDEFRDARARAAEEEAGEASADGADTGAGAGELASGADGASAGAGVGAADDDAAEPDGSDREQPADSGSPREDR